MANQLKSELTLTDSGFSQGIQKAKQQVDKLKTSGDSLDAIQAKFERITEGTKPLKSKLKDLQNLMAGMNLNGLSNTDTFAQIAQQASQYKDALSDASQAVTKLSDDQAGLRAGIETFGALTAVGGVATSAMTLLGVKNEEVARTIAKLQAVQTMLNSVNQIANFLNKDSIAMLKLKQIWTQANAVAEGELATATAVETGATVASTTATKAWNVAKALGQALLGNFTGLLLLAGAGLVTYALCTDDATEAEEEHTRQLEEEKKALEDRQKAVEDAIDGTKAYVSSYANTISGLMGQYKALQAQWKSLSTTQAKQEWIERNKNALDNLNISYGNLQDVEDAMVNNTSRVVASLEKRARAMALQTSLVDKYKKLYEEEEKLTDELTKTKPNADIITQTQNNIERLKKSIDDTANKLAGLGNVGGSGGSKKSGGSSGSGGSGGRSGRSGGSNSTPKKQDPIGDAEKAYKLAMKQYTNELMANADDLEARSNFNKQMLSATKTLLNAYYKNGDTNVLESDRVQVLIGVQKDYENQIKEAEKAQKDETEAKKKLADEEKRQANLTKQMKDATKDATSSKSSIGDRLGFNSGTKQENRQNELNDLIQKYDTLSDAIDKMKEEGMVDVESLTEAQNALNDIEQQIYTIGDAVENAKIGETIIDGLSNIREIGGFIDTLRDDPFKDCKDGLDGFLVGLDLLMNTLQMYQSIQTTINTLSTIFAIKKKLETASITANTTATSANTVVSQANQSVKSNEAIADATASGAKMPYPLNIVAIAMGVAAVVAALATAVFAQGGIADGGGKITGGSTSADKLLIRVNSGEMILNKTQQARLWRLLDGKESIHASNMDGRVRFTLTGRELVGLLENENLSLSHRI